eukprot:3005737-Amphidinium_carterae.1
MSVSGVDGAASLLFKCYARIDNHSWRGSPNTPLVLDGLWIAVSSKTLLVISSSPPSYESTCVIRHSQAAFALDRAYH